MNQWHLYSLETGIFTGRRATGPDEAPPDHVAGHAWWKGDIGMTPTRVDMETRELVPYFPPSPGPDYEWNGLGWVLSGAVLSARSEAQGAKQAIVDQESKQLRAMRELMLNPLDEAALLRLREIDAAIAAQRPLLSVRK